MPKKFRPRPVYFETTVPVIRQCSACGVWLAAGVAEGIKAEIELAVQLDTGQRLWCVMNKVEMYALRRTGLIQMDSMRLTDPRWEALFPQHHCHIRWTVPDLGAFRRPPRDYSIPF
jgi:hypothetical protein